MNKFGTTKMETRGKQQLLFLFVKGACARSQVNEQHQLAIKLRFLGLVGHSSKPLKTPCASRDSLLSHSVRPAFRDKTGLLGIIVRMMNITKSL